jgi:predicted phosphodiesterase
MTVLQRLFASAGPEVIIHAGDHLHRLGRAAAAVQRV